MKSSTQQPSRTRFKKLLPHAEGPHLVTGGHFLQEDSGPEIAAQTIEFVEKIPQRDESIHDLADQGDRCSCA